MTTRLGRVETAVLECLRNAGKPSRVRHIAVDVHIATGKGDIPEISHSEYVSIRRAVNSLALKRMIRVGHPLHHNLRDVSTCRAVCWLPEHEAPEVIVRTNRNQFRTLILESLRKIDASEISRLQQEAINHRHIPNWVIDLYAPHPGDVPYREIIEPIVRGAGDAEIRFRMALNRATLSLIKDGQIKGLLLMDNSYPKQKRRIFYVRLTGVA